MNTTPSHTGFLLYHSRGLKPGNWNYLEMNYYFRGDEIGVAEW